MSRLAIHARVHLTSDGEQKRAAYVRCPEDGRWAPLEACRRCAKNTHIDDRAVTCDADARPSAHPDREPIVAVMEHEVLCVEAHATARDVTELLATHDAPIAIVADPAGHAIGVCARSDLARVSPSRRVETCMTPFVVTLFDTATVSDAVEAILERRLHHVPVLAEGRVVGLVTPRALIAWLARSLREVHEAK
jgi:CBS domain-containing protein